MNDSSLLNDHLYFLESLLRRLEKNETIDSKISILEKLFVVENFLKECPKSVLEFIEIHSSLVRYVLYSVVAIGQGTVIFQKTRNYSSAFLAELVEQLVEVEHFYAHAGGIIGYHKKILELITESRKEKCLKEDTVTYLHPAGPFIQEEDKEIRSVIREAIEQLFCLGEIYPLGGAGDRLNLIDAENKRFFTGSFSPFFRKDSSRRTH